MKLRPAILPLITTAFCLIAANSCTSQQRDVKKETSELNIIIGREDFQAIKNATSIRLYAIRSPSSETVVTAPKKIEIVGAAKNQVIQILTLDQSYILDKTKKCLFVPEYALEFEGQTPLLILISPSCKQLKIIKSSGSATLDIDPAFDQLMNIINHVN